VSKIEQAVKKLESARAQSESAPAPRVVKGAPTGQISDRIIAFHSPSTALAENFKQFNTVIRAMTQGAAHSIAFTSATDGEGKSVVAANFAVALAADSEGEVCLVDGDLRNPSLHKLMGLTNSAGLSEALRGTVPVGDVCLGTAVERLKLVPAGTIPHNPSELFRSRKFGQVLEELRASFEFVVFDTAPVLPAADTIHLGEQIDAMVFVIKAAQTHRRQAARAVELLSHTNVLGFILNQMEPDKSVKESQ